MIPLSGDIPSAKGAICEKIDSNSIVRGTSTLKRGFAHMLKNGVVMDVTTVEQAQIAEEAGAVSVMVLDKLPSDVRKAGGVARTAVIGLDGETVNKLCKISSEDNKIIEAVNFNCPGQTVIAGHTVAIDNITPTLKKEGAKIVKKLPISIAAHTSLLKPVAIDLKNELQKIKYNENTFDIIHNYDLSVSQIGSSLQNVLAQQVCSPVRWIETLEKFKTYSITDIIEIGPGSVLSGLVKRFDKSIATHSTSTIEDIKILRQGL